MMEAEAKDDVVVSALNGYLTAFAEGNYEQAGEEVSPLMEMDCGVCQAFGQHLTAFVVAAETATRDEARWSVEKTAMGEAEYIRDEVVKGS